MCAVHLRQLMYFHCHFGFCPHIDQQLFIIFFLTLAFWFPLPKLIFYCLDCTACFIALLPLGLFILSHCLQLWHTLLLILILYLSFSCFCWWLIFDILILHVLMRTAKVVNIVPLYYVSQTLLFCFIITVMSILWWLNYVKTSCF